MTMDHYRRQACRLCDSSQLQIALALPATPPCDAYVTEEQLSHPQKIYPLDIYQCAACGHFQLLDIVSPEILFPADYSYFSGRTSIVKHFAEYAKMVMEKNALPHGSLVIDIGSNDGSFLRFFKEAGMRVLGVDPAQGVVDAANSQGIETIHSLFDEQTADKILQTHGRAQVITANNVFAHADDLQGMAKNIRSLLADNGVFVFEVSYFPDVVENLLLGTIFHEHLSYHTIRPLIPFLQAAGLELIEVEHVPIQGGSVICTAQVIGGGKKPSPAIVQFIHEEETKEYYPKGYYRPHPLQAFADRLDMLRSLSIVIRELKEAGKTFAGFGASRGGVLLTFLLSLEESMEFIVDDSPDKQGKYSPGHHLPILSTAALYEKMPDYTFLLAWVHSKNIIKAHQGYAQKGGKFITFFPNLKIIGKAEMKDFS